DDPLALIEQGDIDFAFAFGRHAELPAIGQALIARGIPFAIEKPAGLNARDVAGLRRAAEAKGLYVAVPLVQRFGALNDLLQRLAVDEGARFTSVCWRFFAGPPERYLENACAWMLEPELSGGGSLINLAAHFVDLSHHLLGGTAATVTARTANALHGRAVEDYALVSFATAEGKTATIETGYCFPNHPAKREYSFSLISGSHYVQSDPDGVWIFRPGGDAPERIAVDHDSDPLYGAFATRVLEDFRAGRPPQTGLGELEAAMRTMDAAYRSVREGREIRVGE
ncbi:MAG: Gfo/Idh/MocA family oxidoreductase, partial [Pirellulales bacterium]|nr:Gfo/Idh/MocA family oxidoreductase [Pirellulales bacterium]